MNRRWLVLSAFCMTSGALAAAACGGDDNGATNGTPDAGMDATAVEAGADAGEDAAAADVGVPETSTIADTGSEGSSTVNAQCVAFDASGLDDASVTAGFQQVWQVYRCSSCHQKVTQTVDDAGHGIVLSGNNDGLGDSGMIFPPNLTGDPATGIGCWTNADIQNAILEGVNPEGGTLCKPMPKFGQPATTSDGGPKAGYPMDAGTAQEIVDYLRSLPVVTNQVHATSCPASVGSDAAAYGPIDAPGQ